MRGEPEPTRASIGHGGSTRDLPQRTPGQSEGSEPNRPEGSDPMREAGAPSTGSLATHEDVVLCPPHRGSYGLTTDDPVQHGEGAKRRPRWWMTAQYNAANNTSIIKAGAR